MRTNFAIAALIFPMIQAVVFGLGMLGLLIANASAGMFPAVIAATFVFAVPIALTIAPRLRSKAWRQRHGTRLIPA